jgi:hypothetical protein
MSTCPYSAQQSGRQANIISYFFLILIVAMSSARPERK